MHQGVDGGSVQVLDVREPGEWQEGHVDGSVLLPLDQLTHEIGEGEISELDARRPVVAVCRSGTRSTTAVERLRAAGFDADHLDGGLDAWVREGLPLVRPDGSPGEVSVPDDERGLHDLMLGLVEGLEAYTGGREPTEEDTRGYLRERLRAQGKDEEEIAAILDSL